MASNPAFDSEQRFVDVAYERLDELRSMYREKQQSMHTTHGVGNAQGWTEREALSAHLGDMASRLSAVEDRLVFGRLDMSNADTRYIGRTALNTENGDSLLIDWRAPAAAAFYRATPVDPQGVTRRRHIILSGRTVAGIEDELIDTSSPHASTLDIQGEGALMAALGKARDGRMGDIVATIQGEQDRIIRAPGNGMLIVQGGPGSGKTAVALHRAAYLLHADRERLERSGVLLIGPSRTFLRYIEKVLPSLGETGVVSRTIGDLVPGLRTTSIDEPDVAHVKGLGAWIPLLKRAVKDLVQVPQADQKLQVWNRTVTLKVDDVRQAIAELRQSHRPHNALRDDFAMKLMKVLAERIIIEGASGDRATTVIDSEDINDWLIEVRDSLDARRAINKAWMPTSATTLLQRLWAKPALLARLNKEVGSPFTSAQLALVVRERGSEWTVSDVPLLDHLEEYLGTHPLLNQTHSAQTSPPDVELNDTERIEAAQRAMATMNLGGGIVTAEMLAASDTSHQVTSPLSERASQDRKWTYGHIIVDEAQELTPMAWASLLRRCPSRSFTIVGDLDQKRGNVRVSTWEEALGSAARGISGQHVLSVSYRTPASLMKLAEAVCARAGHPVAYPMRSVREVPDNLHIHHVASADVANTVTQVGRQACDQLDALHGQGNGRAGIIVPASMAQLFGADEVGARSLDQRLSVLTPTAAKGLEFDHVILVEPARILREGIGDLFVAMTRSTHSMSVVSSTALPAGFDEWND